jgi:hypothetical protein
VKSKIRKSTLEKSWGPFGSVAESIHSLKSNVDDYKHVGAGIYLADPEPLRESAAILAGQTLDISVDLMRIAGAGIGGEKRLKHITTWVKRDRNGRR